jgi:DNA-binding NtrC family response regulator
MEGLVAQELRRILIVDDEEGARESLEIILEDHYDVEAVEDGMRALARIQARPFDVVLLDVNMPKFNGLEVLKWIKDHNDAIEVIMVSAADRAREATVSLKSGAIDYITKPYEPQEILDAIEKVIKRRSQPAEVQSAHRFTGLDIGHLPIISQAENMAAVFRLIAKVAETSSSVIISGESGTGKELVARALHAGSTRTQKPFVAINCAAIPPDLIESELFGHEKGAFTSAHARNIGKFEYAHGGTIFLDEISSLRLEFQAKLLRVLQEREFSRVGSHQTIKVDVRVIAATSTPLEMLIKEKQFRNDLYFRLNVIPIHLPPLRHRKGDVPLLANFFLTKFNRALDKKVRGISSDALEVLESYPWPGNVRELENLIERLVVLGSPAQWIHENDLPFDLLIREESGESCDHLEKTIDLGLIRARQEFERQYVLRALQRCRWNQTDTARVLKIHRNTLLQKMKILDLRSQTDE